MRLTTKQILAIAKFLESRGYDQGQGRRGRAQYVSEPYLSNQVLLAAGGDGSVWVSIDDPDFKAEHQNFDPRGTRVL